MYNSIAMCTGGTTMPTCGGLALPLVTTVSCVSTMCGCGGTSASCGRDPCSSPPGTDAQGHFIFLTNITTTYCIWKAYVCSAVFVLEQVFILFYRKILITLDCGGRGA